MISARNKAEMIASIIKIIISHFAISIEKPAIPCALKYTQSKFRWRTPLQATGYVSAPALVVSAIKNRVFSFADMVLFLHCFPDFQHSF